MSKTAESAQEIRHDWSRKEVQALFDLPMNDLMFQAQTVHRQHFDPNAVQLSTLLNIKTGACAEDCSYCSQSVVNDILKGREGKQEGDNDGPKGPRAHGLTPGPNLRLRLIIG